MSRWSSLSCKSNNSVSLFIHDLACPPPLSFPEDCQGCTCSPSWDHINDDSSDLKNLLHPISLKRKSLDDSKQYGIAKRSRYLLKDPCSKNVTIEALAIVLQHWMIFPSLLLLCKKSREWQRHCDFLSEKLLWWNFLDSQDGSKPTLLTPPFAATMSEYMCKTFDLIHQDTTSRLREITNISRPLKTFSFFGLSPNSVYCLEDHEEDVDDLCWLEDTDDDRHNCPQTETLVTDEVADNKHDDHSTEKVSFSPSIPSIVNEQCLSRTIIFQLHDHWLDMYSSLNEILEDFPTCQKNENQFDRALIKENLRESSKVAEITSNKPVYTVLCDHHSHILLLQRYDSLIQMWLLALTYYLQKLVIRDYQDVLLTHSALGGDKNFKTTSYSLSCSMSIFDSLSCCCNFLIKYFSQLNRIIILLHSMRNKLSMAATSLLSCTIDCTSVSMIGQEGSRLSAIMVMLLEKVFQPLIPIILKISSSNMICIDAQYDYDEFDRETQSLIDSLQEVIVEISKHI